MMNTGRLPPSSPSPLLNLPPWRATGGKSPMFPRTSERRCWRKSTSSSRPPPDGMRQVYTVPEGIRRLRADKALAVAFPEHSRTALQRAFDAGHVTLRGAAIKRDHAVAGGDVLEFAFPDAVPMKL